MKKLNKIILSLCMAISLCMFHTSSIKAECEHAYSSDYHYDCINGGWIEYECVYCGYTYKVEKEPIGSHKYELDYRYFNCEEGGFERWECEDCYDYYYVDLEPSGNHEYELDYSYLDCETGGYECYQCKYCDDYYDKDLAPTGSHEFVLEETYFDCVEGGYEYYTCKNCDCTYEEDLEPVGEHSFYQVVEPASFDEYGCIYSKCSLCGYEDAYEDINRVSTEYTINKKKFVYDGKEHKVEVSDLMTTWDYTKLIEGTDYILENNTATRPGVYKATLKLIGNYTGTKNITYSIVPAKVTTKVKLYGYDDIQVSWNKVLGATGYRVYYTNSTLSSWKYVDVTGTSRKFSNLLDGKQYTFKVCPYVTSASGTKYINTTSPKVCSIYTLKKVGKPAAYKYTKGKVKIRWENIDGESGYQISRSTSSTKTNIVSTISTTTGDGKLLDTKEGRKYYYKVRAYRVVDGKKIFGPWSKVKAYTCGKTPKSGFDKSDPIVKIALSKKGEHGLCSEIVYAVQEDFVKKCWNGNAFMYNVSKGRLRKVTSPIPGDIVYYDSVPPSNVNHEAIYLGKGKCLHGNWGGSATGNVWDGMGTAQIGELYIKGASKPVFYRIK